MHEHIPLSAAIALAALGLGAIGAWLFAPRGACDIDESGPIAEWPRLDCPRTWVWFAVVFVSTVAASALVEWGR